MKNTLAVKSFPPVRTSCKAEQQFVFFAQKLNSNCILMQLSKSIGLTSERVKEMGIDRLKEMTIDTKAHAQQPKEKNSRK